MDGSPEVGEMKNKTDRAQKGAILPLVAALTIVLTMLGAGILTMMMMFGANQEMEQATMAGALGMGQNVLKVTDKTSATDREQFADLGYQCSGEARFTPANVNRVMAKALLMRINFEDMKARGLAGGAAEANVINAENSAQRIADSIKEEITDSKNLQPTFLKYANSNSLRMFGPDTKVKPASDKWETGYVDAGAESNIYFDPKVLPIAMRGKLESVSKDGKTYLKGYTTQCAAKSPLRLVPYRHAERPALISADDFYGANKRKPGAHDLPNAWACRAQAQARGSALVSTAMVQINPQQEFEMRQQDGWVRIVLEPNEAVWKWNTLRWVTSKYPYSRTYRHKVFYVPVAGVGYSFANVGNEAEPSNLWNCLFPDSARGNEPAQAELLQRLRELKPNLSDAQLIKPLQQAQVDRDTTDKQVFYVYLKDDNLKVSRAFSGDIPPSIKTTAQADGRSTYYTQNWSLFRPNYSIVAITGLKCRWAWWTQTEGSVRWQPGTGYNGCLGEIAVSRAVTTWMWGGSIPDPPGPGPAPFPPPGDALEYAHSLGLPAGATMK
jgi:hypothetical protein